MSPERRSFDVVVVGAGTAGSACALFLARKGLRVALLETRPLAEAGARWENVEIFDLLTGSIADGRSCRIRRSRLGRCSLRAFSARAVSGCFPTVDEGRRLADGRNLILPIPGRSKSFDTQVSHELVLVENV